MTITIPLNRLKRRKALDEQMMSEVEKAPLYAEEDSEMTTSRNDLSIDYSNSITLVKNIDLVDSIQLNLRW